VILPRRVTYCLIVVVSAIGLLYRYPLGLGHEAGSDTTFIHTLANSLSERGTASWILHPLSYFGLYALSYPSAMPFLFASLAEVSGVSVEGSILLTGLGFSVVAGLSAFAATRSVREDDRLGWFGPRIRDRTGPCRFLPHPPNHENPGRPVSPP